MLPLMSSGDRLQTAVPAATGRPRAMKSSTRVRRLVGWLLRTNRLLTDADTALRTGKEFARLFRAGGEQPLKNYQVTRWERGQTAVSRTVIRRYEHMLALRPESLVGVCDAVARAESVPIEPGRSSDHDGLLDDLVERASGGAPMSGPQWAMLSELVAGEPTLTLCPRRWWEGIAHRLLDELVVADHGEWLLRQEAMSRLLEHPKASRYAVAQCIELVRDPQSPAVVEPMSLLDVTDAPAANAFVLAQVAQPDDERALQGALLAAAQKLRRGHFARPERDVITAAAARWARDGLNPDRLALRATARMDRPASGHDVARQVCLIAGAALSAADDPYLETLVRQALFGEDVDRRMIAAMCMAVTPYQQPVGAAVLGLIEDGLAHREDRLAVAGLRTLTNLGVDAHRPLIHRILTRPGFSVPVRLSAAWALPHCRGAYSYEVWREVMAAHCAVWQRSPSPAQARVLQGLAYGVGTDGHPELLDEIRADATLPQDVRRTAWWLRRSRLTLTRQVSDNTSPTVG
jgi:hypothetical protein